MDVPDVYKRQMGDGVEAEHQALTFEQRWHGDAAAIPRQTDMTAE